MHKLTDDTAEGRFYRLTPGDIDAGFDADYAWDSGIIDLTRVDARATILGAQTAGAVAVDSLLADMFPAPLVDDRDGPNRLAS